MLRNKPKLRYCGLTVILSNPSRFDKLSLLTSTGGVLFNELLYPDYNQMQCDVRIMEDNTPFLEGTKCILVCGEAAMHKWLAKDTGNNTLNEMRGSPFYIQNIPTIASFFPQDCADIRGHEQRLNEESKEYTGEEDEKEDEDEGDTKSMSATKRANYAFWLSRDILKCKRILSSGSSVWPIEKEATYKLYPTAEEAVNILQKYKDHYFYFDIETDYEDQNLLCFSFMFYNENTKSEDIVVYSIPILNHNYQPAYSGFHFILRALVIAIRDNILVAHNGHGFDFLVLGMKYSIPIYRTFDTLIAQHRIYPDIEKSLGHCTSMWTYQRFHKDTDSRAYRTHEHVMQKLKYCGKDVFTMFLIHQAQLKFAKTIPGLEASISVAQRSIRPYLIATLMGMKYSKEKLDTICKENDELMIQYVRIIKILIGEQGMIEVRKAITSKTAGLFPGSNPQCCKYFHDMLGYPVVIRSQKTGKPSLGKKAMFKLALKHDNPVITFSLLYRTTQKEYSSLKFVPWKDDNNKRIDYNKYLLLNQ